PGTTTPLVSRAEAPRPVRCPLRRRRRAGPETVPKPARELRRPRVRGRARALAGEPAAREVRPEATRPARPHSQPQRRDRRTPARASTTPRAARRPESRPATPRHDWPLPPPTDPPTSNVPLASRSLRLRY